MKTLSTLLLAVTLLAACKKSESPQPVSPTPQPVMQYLNLQDATVGFGQLKKIDINSDGTDDFLASTLLVGDPILRRDRRMYFISSAVNVRMLQDANNQSPVLNKNEEIKLQHTGYGWFEVTSQLLAEKIIPETGASFWQGNWRQAIHQYLPVQLQKNGNLYHGWIELSFDMQQEKLILHKAAISTEAGKTIRAGV